MSGPLLCAVSTCGKPRRKREWCSMHYARWLDAGDVRADVPSKYVKDPVPQFWSRVSKSDGCWSWTGTVRKSGYGVFQVGGQGYVAHRFAYELLVGPVPAGLVVDHACHNEAECHGGPCEHRACVNPEHLRAVTGQTNVLASPHTPAHRNAAKTHCDHDHEFTPENTYIDRNGHRTCRICRREHERRYRARQRKARAA